MGKLLAAVFVEQFADADGDFLQRLQAVRNKGRIDDGEALADAIDDELLYTVRRKPDGIIHIYRHGFLDDAEFDLLLLKHRLAEDTQLLG